ncbi:MAG: hypothetical protein WCX73_02220 [Candidatus Pacearchaeota archaeon]|jgi:hypothetical protein
MNNTANTSIEVCPEKNNAFLAPKKRKNEGALKFKALIGYA